MDTLATNLASLRGGQRLLTSQKAIADKAGIDQRTVGRILNKEHAATLTQVERLAGVFGVEPWQLLAPELGTHLYQISADKRLVAVTAPVPGASQVISVTRENSADAQPETDQWKRTLKGKEREAKESPPSAGRRRRGQKS